MSNNIDDQNNGEGKECGFSHENLIEKHLKDMRFLKKFMKLSFILILSLYISK